MTYITFKQAKERLGYGQPVYAEYNQPEGQVKRRVFQMINHTDEVTLIHGPGDKKRLAWNRVSLTRN